MKRIKSESGDWFIIPDGQEYEYEDYLKCVYENDGEAMEIYEDGTTGWIYDP